MRYLLMLLPLSAILGMNYYVFLRLSRLVYADVRFFVPLLLTALWIAMFIIPAFTGVLPWLYRIASSWFIIMVYLLILFLIMDFLRIFLPMQNILNGNWLSFGILTLVLTSIFTYGYFRYQKKERVELSINVGAKNISPLQPLPLRIVAISDLHLGYTIGKAEFDKWIELINAENPDIVLLAGDIKDNNIRPLLEQNISSSFRNIKSKYGVYACPGNHEHIAGGTDTLLENFFREANVSLLRDTAALINDEFYIIGREDYGKKDRKPLEEIVQPLDKNKPLILLDHQPYHLEEAEKNGIDFQFSGHTHNGQVFPINLITNLMYEISYGYKKKGNTHIYVSSGIGIWGAKFRIGTRSEYVVIEIINYKLRIKN